MGDNHGAKKDYNWKIIDAKFQGLEEKVAELKVQVNDLSKINNVLAELKYLSEQQAKMIERLFEVQIEQGDTLIDIANTTNRLGYRVDTTEETINNLNEEWCESREKGIIHVGEIAKSAILVALGGILAAIIGLVIY